MQFFFTKKFDKKENSWINIGIGKDESVNNIIKTIGKKLNYRGQYFNNHNKPDRI